MSKYNLGTAKASILSKLNEQATIKGFIGLLRESDLLKTELVILDNIENKHIANEDLAIKYIDENIDLLKAKGYTKENFTAEHDKIVPLVEKVGVATSSRENLHKNIHTLLYESLQGKKSTNVNRLHDSFVFVLEHLKNNKKVVTESSVLPKDVIVNDFVLVRSIQEFNKKYSTVLSENEMKVLTSIMNNDSKSKKETFSSIKEAALSELKNVKTEIDGKRNLDVNEQREVDQFKTKINESITKVSALEYKDESYEQDILSLVDLLGG